MLRGFNYHAVMFDEFSGIWNKNQEEEKMQQEYLKTIFGNCKANYVVEEPKPPSILFSSFDSYEKIKAHKQFLQHLELWEYWVEVMNDGEPPWNTYSITLRDAAGNLLDISEEEHYTAQEAEEEALDYWNSLEEKDKMLKSVTKTNLKSVIAVSAEAELVYPAWVKA